MSTSLCSVQITKGTFIEKSMIYLFFQCWILEQYHEYTEIKVISDQLDHSEK